MKATRKTGLFFALMPVCFCSGISRDYARDIKKASEWKVGMEDMKSWPKSLQMALPLSRPQKTRPPDRIINAHKQLKNTGLSVNI